MTFQLAADDLLEHVLPQTVYQNGDIKITNQLLMTWIVAGLMLLIFFWLGAVARKRTVPTGVHNFFESILSFLRTEVFRPALGANVDRFTPFLWTVFFFVLFCNLLGMIPVNEIATSIKMLVGGGSDHGDEFHPVHVWGTATANITVTASLALVAFVVVHLSGVIQAVRVKMDPSLAPHHTGNDHAEQQNKGQPHGIEDERDVHVHDREVPDGHDHAHGVHHSKEFGGQPFPVACVTGVGAYIWNFAPHPQIGNKAMDLVMWFVLLVLELMGAIVKPVSLAVRLFANMLAGHLVLAALIGMIPFVTILADKTVVAEATWKWMAISPIVLAGCTALSVLELFVAFLQAYIFTFLTTLFIASAVAPEH
jgi:F0F1-type ATP synthase membrane subunit a